MKPQLKHCKNCGRMPAVISPDVCEDAVYYTRCKCGVATTWWSTAEKAAQDWNKHYSADKPKCGRAMSVLMKAKEVRGCA